MLLGTWGSADGQLDVRGRGEVSTSGDPAGEPEKIPKTSGRTVCMIEGAMRFLPRAQEVEIIAPNGSTWSTSSLENILATATENDRETAATPHLFLAKEPVDASCTQKIRGGLPLWVWPHVTNELPSTVHAMPSGRVEPVLGFPKNHENIVKKNVIRLL